MYEAGEISRFATAGDFASYCRCVDAQGSALDAFRLICPGVEVKEL